MLWNGHVVSIMSNEHTLRILHFMRMRYLLTEWLNVQNNDGTFYPEKWLLDDTRATLLTLNTLSEATDWSQSKTRAVLKEDKPNG